MRTEPVSGQRSRRRRVIDAGAIVAVAVLTFVGAPAATAAPTTPPPVRVLSSQPGAGPGDIFITPTGDTTAYANGPEIIDRQGDVVWFHAAPQGLTAADSCRLPRPALSRTAGPDLVAGHRPGRPVQWN